MKGLDSLSQCREVGLWGNHKNDCMEAKEITQLLDRLVPCRFHGTMASEHHSDRAAGRATFKNKQARLPTLVCSLRLFWLLGNCINQLQDAPDYQLTDLMARFQKATNNAVFQIKVTSNLE